jgi:transcriptional regulator with XRE-family HTH domain
MANNLTIPEWEKRLGEQIRALRVAARLEQRVLAEAANVSLGAVRNLETGRGSSTKTLVAVLRALDRADWLTTLAPPVSVSPIAMLRSKTPSPQRVYRERSR